MTVVLDTCGLLWLTLDPSELSGQAHKAIQDSTRMLVCAASLWEIALKNKKGKIELGMSIQDYASRCAQTNSFEILPVDHDTWIESALLEWEHRDPIDRLIVTLAKRESAKIVTDDRIIKGFYKKCIS